MRADREDAISTCSPAIQKRDVDIHVCYAVANMRTQELDFSGKFFPRLNAIPKGIKLVTLARSIRWFGWGFGEALLPIFILTFTQTTTQAALINSTYDILFLLSLPLVGFIADVVSSKTLLIIGLLLYPFIGLSYYLAGATGIVLFVILAKGINGIAYCLDCVGVDTYIRRVAPRTGIASAFGYMASLAEFGWLVAALIGVVLVRFVPVHTLLFLVTPFSLLALIPLAYAERDKTLPSRRLNMKALLTPLTSFLKEVAAMRKGMHGVLFLMFFFDIAAVTATFFIPIDAYRSGANLSSVAFLAVLGAVPTLFEFWIAEFIDGSKIKRRAALFIALVALPVLFIIASNITAFSSRVLIAFGIGLAAIFGSLALQSYATVLSRRDRYGEVSSMLEGATTFGDLLGPIALALLTDALGFSMMFAIIAALFALIAIYFFRRPIE
jgi:MFS family permease